MDPRQAAGLEDDARTRTHGVIGSALTPLWAEAKGTSETQRRAGARVLPASLALSPVLAGGQANVPIERTDEAAPALAAPPAEAFAAPKSVAETGTARRCKGVTSPSIVGCW